MADTPKVSDPHPEYETHSDRQRHPGGANPPRDQVSGAYLDRNDGKQEKKPDAAVDGPSP